MSQEVQSTTTFLYNKNGAKYTDSQLGTLTEDAAGDGVIKETMAATTGGVVVPLGSVTTPGFVYFHNLSATHFVLLSFDNGSTYPVRINALKDCRFYCASGVTLKIKGDTATCLVEFFLADQ